MKALIVDIAALGWNLVETHRDIVERFPLDFARAAPPFPAVTCTSQAVFRTALPPAENGMVCNGRFDATAFRTEFWNQSARLVQGPRIWSEARRRGKSVGMLFWQQSLGEELDLVLSPAPIHKHHGGMLQDCYSKPRELYPDLCRTIGRSFDLKHYWGPMASMKSSAWITEATCQVMADPSLAPDILLTYLPHLDYVLQKQGPADHDTVAEALRELADMLGTLVECAQAHDYEVIAWGDYAITAADKVVFPNRHLQRACLFDVRRVKGKSYPDLYGSRAFALVDHQVAHVYVNKPYDLSAVRDWLETLDGIERIEPRALIEHPDSGDFILIAEPGAWFAYPWWTDEREAPDYATHVDIHNKIGFDPCELFWGIPLLSVSQDPTRVRGTHGRNDTPVCIGSTIPELNEATTLEQLASRTRHWLTAM